MLFTAHQYQIDAAERAAGRQGTLILADPGCGKTAIALMLVSELVAKGHWPRPALLVAPLRVITSVWKQEAGKWEQFQHLRFRSLRDGLAGAGADVHLANFEILGKLHDSGALSSYRTLIVDESSLVKNPTAARTKLLTSHVHHFDRRVLLTGTPTPNSLMDIWSQAFLVDGGAGLGADFYRFRRRHFDDVNSIMSKWFDYYLKMGRRVDQIINDAPPEMRRFLAQYHQLRYVSKRLKGFSVWPDWRLKTGAAAAIYEAIAPLCVRIDASKVLTLPELVDTEIEIEIPAKFRKLSIETARQFLRDPEGHVSKYTTSRQAAGGCSPEGVLHTAKLEALDQLISELYGRPLIIFFNFRPEGAAIQSRYNCPVIMGGTSDAVSQDIIERWEKKEIPVLALQPDATAYGLNLQTGGSHVCWFGPPDKNVVYYQGVRRIWRQGAGSRVFNHRLVARGTIDDPIYTTLNHKEHEQADLFAAVERWAQCG